MPLNSPLKHTKNNNQNSSISIAKRWCFSIKWNTFDRRKQNHPYLKKNATQVDICVGKEHGRFSKKKFLKNILCSNEWFPFLFLSYIFLYFLYIMFLLFSFIFSFSTIFFFFRIFFPSSVCILNGFIWCLNNFMTSVWVDAYIRIHSYRINCGELQSIALLIFCVFMHKYTMMTMAIRKMKNLT